jgi:methylated-DNA-protein-cysteine methyltransferase-like protein
LAKRGLLPFTRRVRTLIRSIPRGTVASYGQIASLAGEARQARQVAWILHATPDREGLPWHRVINSRGLISLPPGRGGKEQARRLRAEGLRVDGAGAVDLKIYGWKTRPKRGRAPDLSDRDLEKLG